MRAADIEGRKRDILAGAPLAGLGGDRLDARQAIGRIGLKAGLRLLAVADDIDAEFWTCASFIPWRDFPGRDLGGHLD